MDDELTPLPVASGRARPGGALPPPAPRSRPDLALAAVPLAIVLFGVAFTLGGSDRERATNAPSAAVPGGDEAPPAGWRRGGPGPLPSGDGHVEVWTDTELVVWGGDPVGGGAAYHAGSDTWRRIGDAPFPPRVDAAGAWTGVEMLVWGGREPAGPARADGAAYDPIADRWRLLAPAPLAAVSPAASVLAAGEWVVLAGDDLVPSNRAAAYDPAADSWRLVAELPFPVTEATALWTGAEVVVLGADTTGSDPTRTRAAAWDPARDAWRMLPAAPVNGLAAAAVWTGEEIVTWDFELRSAALAPAGEPTWEPLPDLPLVLYECDPLGTAAGDLVYAEHCGQGALWYRSTRSWVRLTHPRTLSSQPHWTGNELLFWMGRFVDSADGIWRFMPSG